MNRVRTDTLEVQPEAGLPALYTLDEVAARCRAPLSTVRWWAQCGRLRTVKLGRRPLVREADLRLFIEAHLAPEPPAPRRRRAA